MDNTIKPKDLLWPIIISLLILFGVYSNTIIQTKTKIVFCNVGQGDATYIRTFDGIDLLIDAGSDQKTTHCLGKHMPFYDHKIEYVFITHPEADHYAGLAKLNQHYYIDNLYLSTPNNQNKQFQSLIKQLKKNRLNYLYQGDRLEINQFISLNILWPSKTYAAANLTQLKKPETNELSLVMLFQENDFRMLLTGDISASILERLLKQEKISVYLLKIPHHGSKSGLNKKILQLANPQTAVISVGKNNRYHHPDLEVINLLKASKINIRRTDQEGDLIFLTK
jgi:beta-lactamase superfamily II metal-dependent hydrolase